MAVTLNNQPVAGSSGSVSDGLTAPPQRVAATAAARVGRAGVVLSTLGVLSSLFVVVRLVETWRVSAHAASHRISIAGLTLSYPAANFAAIIVVVLALLGLAVTVLAGAGAVRELIVARRFGRRIEAESPMALDDALVIDDVRPHAFCAGLLRPRVYVSTGAVEMLDDATLQAVLAHERHHAHRRDPLRLAAGRVLARSLFFVPGLPQLVRRQQALAELSADESAVNAAPGNRSALAQAMLSFSEASAAGHAVGIDPTRVDHLLGEPVSWRFPTLLCLTAGLVIGVLAAVAILAGQVATGSATLAPPFLSRQPCIVIVALVPGAVGVGAFRVLRRVRTSYDALS